MFQGCVNVQMLMWVFADIMATLPELLQSLNTSGSYTQSKQVCCNIHTTAQAIPMVGTAYGGKSSFFKFRELEYHYFQSLLEILFPILLCANTRLLTGGT